jgi:hypothetical protein
MRPRTALALASGALAAAMAAAAIKAHIPGDHEDKHEDNTFGLPNGDPIRRKMRAFYRQQLAQVAGTISTVGHSIDSPLPRMGDWTDPMASVMTPILGVYWDKAGKSLRGRIGLDPAGWRVTDPNVHRAIAHQALSFCASTNRTTDLGIADARDAVRDQLARGLIGRGDTVPQLTARIKTVFTHASKSKATQIARTEASRAVHEASIMSARATGLVTRKHWLLSSGACPRCHAVAAAFPEGIALEGEFAHQGHNPDYSSVRYPPLHPNCRCSITLELMDEPPDHDREKEKEKEREKKPRETSDDDDRDRLPRPRPDPGLHAPSPGRTLGFPISARTARRVAAFAVPAAVPLARVGIERAARAYRARVERKRREGERTGGGMKPVDHPEHAGVPPLHKVNVNEPAAQVPPGPIADRIAAYMAGAGKARLEALANLDEAHAIQALAIREEQAAALRELDRLRKSKGYGHAETIEADRKVQELTDKKEAHRDPLKGYAPLVAEALALPAARRALLNTRMVTATRAVPLVARESEGFLGQVLAADDGTPAGLKVEYGALRNKAQRAYYDDRNRRVNLAGDEPIPTIVHEYGHAIEHQWPHVGQLSAEFLDYRTAGEKIRKLASLFPRKGYDQAERGRKDRFGLAFDKEASDAWYVGKEYRRKAARADTRFGTEILSSGLEKLMTDPVKFAKKDPEFCSYILGILDGSLR